MIRLASSLACALLTLLVAAAYAQPAAAPAAGPPPEGPTVYNLTLSPAAEPQPALRYSLVAEYLDRKPGNAVPFYYRAILEFVSLPKDMRDEFNKVYQQATEAPLDQLPRAEVEKVLKLFAVPLSQLEAAASRDEVNWDWNLRELDGIDIIAFRLPEIQESRSLGRLLALKARLEIAEGRYDDAVRTLTMGFKLSRDVAEPPLIINGLVGEAIGSILAEQLRELIDAPNSPNLYWALASLPEPAIDLGPAMRQEMSIPLQIFPFLRDAETADRSADEWERQIAKALSTLGRAGGAFQFADQGDDESPGLQARLAASALMLKGYPQAKRDLIEAGFDAERVEGMPVGQVVAIHQARTYRHIYSEMFKWSLLPYPEARERLANADRKLMQEGWLGPAGRSREILPIASLLMPATNAAAQASVRLDSRLNVLRVVEAIRLHAAANDGALPASLADIEVVPVPENPLTGKPYPYRLEDGKAVLEMPAPPRSTPSVGWRLVISLEKGERGASAP